MNRFLRLTSQIPFISSLLSLSRVVAITTAVVTAIPAHAENSVTFYEHPHFQGRSFTLYESEQEDNLHDRRASGFQDWNDRISSIRIRGFAKVTIYRDRSFTGPRFTTSSSISDLSEIPLDPRRNNRSWDNAISSYKARLPGYPYHDNDEDERPSARPWGCDDRYNSWPPGLGVGGCPPGLRKKGLCGLCGGHKRPHWKH